MDYYIIHLVWFALSCMFGYWMYMRGANFGVNLGVRVSAIFLKLKGNEHQVGELVSFVNDLSTYAVRNKDDNSEE